jgi:chemotaxis protein MotB
VKEAVAGYFKDPSGTGKETGSSRVASGEALTISEDNVAQLKEKLEKAIAQMSNFPELKNQVEMTVTAEGLRTELLESATGTFFDVGKPRPNENGKALLVTLAKELVGVPNKISIEGHTHSKVYVGKGDYGNWELSADRANAARRIMQQGGRKENQVSQVRGYADQKLRKKDTPFDPSNRRISVIVHPIEAPPEEKDEAKSEGKPSPGHEAKPETEKEEGGEPKDAGPEKP